MTVLTVDTEPVPARDPIVVEVVETGWEPWERVFRVHHYLLGAGPMPFSTAYTGFDVDSGDPVCFMGMSGIWAGQGRAARACRLVVHPEWQGAGVGMRFLAALCQRELDGTGFIGHRTVTYFHTAHPALCAALRRDARWRQVSQKLTGHESGQPNRGTGRELFNARYGGHFRSVAGYKYIGGER